MKDIYDLFALKEKAIHEKHVSQYMETITKNDPLYYKEQLYWVKDMIKDDISDVSFELVTIEEKNYDYIVTVHQTHKLVDENIDITYNILIKKDLDGYKDYGVYFHILEEDEFILKYVKVDPIMKIFQENIKLVMRDLHHLFDERFDYIVEFKFYDELDMVRQRSGPSYRWKYPMWAKSKESVKVYPYFAKPEDYTGGFQHELIHSLSLSGSKNHIMSWMAEGIAMRYGNGRYDCKNDMMLKYIDQVNLAVPLEDFMDMNLSQLTEPLDIAQYYCIAYMYFDYLSTIYDSKTIMSLFRHIIAKPAPTTDKERAKMACLSFQEVLGIDLQQLSYEYLKWLEEKS